MDCRLFWPLLCTLYALPHIYWSIQLIPCSLSFLALSSPLLSHLLGLSLCSPADVEVETHADGVARHKHIVAGVFHVEQACLT